MEALGEVYLKAWHTVLALPPEKRAANQDAVPGWLQKFLFAMENGSVEVL